MATTPAKDDVLAKIGDLRAFAQVGPDHVERELAAWLGSESGDLFGHFWTAVAGRIRTLIEAASGAFEQRRDEIEAVAAGLVSGVSTVLLGPPGTAKSALVRQMASLCGLAPGEGDGDHAEARHGGYFEYLLTNHTMPEELFGGLNLAELRAGRLVRVTRGKLPRAEIAFLDEVFRGGSHILNTLLAIINEKRYDSGAGSQHVPLLGVVGASNLPPVEPELEAFFDRFPIRIWVRSVLDTSRFVPQRDESAEAAGRVVQHAVDGEIARLCEAWDPLRGQRVRVEGRKSCTNDFRFARLYLLQRVRHVVPQSERFRQFLGLFRMVRDRCRLSDRTLGQLWLYAAALDLLKGKDPTQHYANSDASPDGHLRVFRLVAPSLNDVAYLQDRVEERTRGLHATGKK